MFVLILNEIELPLLTLIDVEKPWIEGSPVPETRQLLSGVPGLVFSQATGFWIGSAQGSAASADYGTTATAIAIAIDKRSRPRGACRSSACCGIPTAGWAARSGAAIVVLWRRIARTLILPD